jgi:cobalt-zinc-cadmium efflux system outer membrane protein
VQAASAIADATASRADEDIRRLRADLRLAFAELVAAQIREEQLTTARDRLRELADILGKRESAGDAAGFDRLRAEREVLEIDTDRALAAADRARAQAILASFFTDVGDPAQLLAMAPPMAPTGRAVPRRARGACRVDAWRAAGLAARSRGGGLRATRRRPPLDPGARGGRGQQVVEQWRRRHRQCDHGACVDSALRPRRPERALATARAAQAESRAAAFRLVLRGQIAALRLAVLERRAVAERYRSQAVSGGDQIARIAQVSYDAGERSILELLDAYRTGLSARVRQAVLDAAVRQTEIELEFVSGWEIR